MSKAQGIIKQIDDHGLTIQRKEWIAFLEDVSLNIDTRYQTAKDEAEAEASEGPADDDDEEAPMGKGLTSTSLPPKSKAKRTKKR